VTHCNLLLLLSCNFNNLNNFVTLASTRLRPPEYDVDALKHVGILAIYKIILICICCAFVGLDNKLKNSVLHLCRTGFSVFLLFRFDSEILNS